VSTNRSEAPFTGMDMGIVLHELAKANVQLRTATKKLADVPMTPERAEAVRKYIKVILERTLGIMLVIDPTIDDELQGMTNG
jgi:hypothetical protein